jgi:hypothetical protein
MAGEKGEQRPGEHHEQQEHIPGPSYLITRRYGSEDAAGQAYFQIRDILPTHPEPTELSVYRVRIGPTLDWHVVVLGEQDPSEPLRETIDTSLGTGQEAQLPEELLTYLVERRNAAKRRGGWSEAHFRPGLGLHFPKRRR